MSDGGYVHMRSWLLKTLTLCGVSARGARVTQTADDVDCPMCLEILREMDAEERNS